MSGLHQVPRIPRSPRLIQIPRVPRIPRLIQIPRVPRIPRLIQFPPVPRLLSLALICAAAIAGAAQQPTYDLLIRSGRVLDGTGGAERVADVAVATGRIAAVADLKTATAARVIDADGLYVTPGFIDMHSHADRTLGLPGLNYALNNLTQGITTVIVGQDGRSAWPLGGRIQQTIELWTKRGLGLNALLLVGHGSVRREVVGDEHREPAAEELQRMRALVRDAMEGGAYGISTGLSYLPGRYGKTDEVIALTAEVKSFGGFYISHLRNQGDGLMDSVEETIRIGRKTGVTVVASHFKSSGRRNFGKARQAMERIAAARKDGVSIFTDVYPWATSSDGIDVDVVPADAYRVAGGEQPGAEQAFAGGRQAIAAERRAALRAGLEDPAKREEIRRLTREAIARRGADLDVIERAADRRLEGLTLAAAAEVLGVDLVDAAIAIDLMDAQVTNYHMNEGDIEEILRHPFTAICTDGTVPHFGEGTPHPRSYGTYPRLIRHYVLQQAVITLADAVRRATGLAADIVGLKDRGYLKPGQAADVVVFDPLTIDSCATYRDPHCYSRGIRYLVVNGAVTLDKGKYTGALAGQIITPRSAIRTGTTP